MIISANNRKFAFFAHSFIKKFRGNIMNEIELLWKMYSKLFNTITDVLPHIENSKAVEILKQAQVDAEELYIGATPSDM